MWTRKELKTRAKAALKLNYWQAVIVAVINMLFVAGGIQSFRQAIQSPENQKELDALMASLGLEELMMLAAIVFGALAVSGIISTLISIFVKNPLEVGVDHFFVMCTDEETVSVKEVLYGFKNDYGNIVKCMFLRGLFTILWTMLFIIPGIIKAFAWILVPYILAENPDMNAKEAMALSAEMMKGNKWKFFVLSLSFIGWHILAAITFGILNIFYVGPYFQLTVAEFYRELRVQA